MMVTRSADLQPGALFIHRALQVTAFSTTLSCKYFSSKSLVLTNEGILSTEKKNNMRAVILKQKAGSVDLKM